ncbi:serine/threonine-protein kinase [Streptomyces sp. NPDC097981]|uniref:serine/threonine-protein kinase n=1 Tax=Streptomyces sp. NPDC097981 TaxID=3155428 RepID=UPI003323239D
MTGQAQPGRAIGGRYRLVGPLGSGGFGRVWRAHDEALDVEVAVKEVWLPQQAGSEHEQEERLARAAREARNAAKLRDKAHIVAVHDVVVEEGTPWIVMRLVEGCSLSEYLRVEGRMPAARVAKVATALLKALKAAHAAGIVHRDLKPANVMLTPDGDVLLTDFGIAVHLTDTRLTVTGGVVGSAEYMAPERLNGGEDQGAGDLFSLGATLYEAVEGTSPFRRDTPTATFAALALHDPPPPQGGDTPLASLITALLAKRPGDRPTLGQALSLAAAAPHSGRYHEDGSDLLRWNGTGWDTYRRADSLTWTPYTPAWSGLAALGSSVPGGRYARIGDTVLYVAELTWGPGSKLGSGEVKASLPLAAAGVGSTEWGWQGTGRYRDGTRGTWKGLTPVIAHGGSVATVFACRPRDGGWVPPGRIPYTWAAGAHMRIQGEYETA